jgi:hypothetical protein
MSWEDLSVNLSDYAAVDGPGEMSSEDMQELHKALEAGAITGRDTADSTSASGAPLKVESLENTLKVITFKESDIQFWKRVPKLPAFNTVEEYNQLQSYGTDRGGFTNEGELPEEEDSIYVRRAQLVKYMGVTKSVTHAMQLVTTHIGDIIQRETTNGTLWILRKVDRALAFGDSDVIPQEFNGYYKQHRDGYGDTMDAYMDSPSVVDLRGKRLSETAMEDGALGIIENHGYPDLFMAPPIVLSDFVKEFHEFKMIQPNTAAVTNGVMGQRVDKFMSQFGEIELGYDKFLKTNAPRRVGSGATHPKAPNGVVADGSTPQVESDDTLSRWGSDDAGDYWFAVAAINRYGESDLVKMSDSKLTMHTVHSADLKFADGGGTYPATGYVIYRTKKNPGGLIAATDFYPIFTISKAEHVATGGYDGGGSTTVVRDRNRFLPDTNQAFMMQADNEVYSFKQLAPLMKMDLAILSPAKRFMVLLYGTPQLYAPKKMVRYINIGRTANA